MILCSSGLRRATRLLLTAIPLAAGVAWGQPVSEPRNFDRRVDMQQPASAAAPLPAQLDALARLRAELGGSLTRRLDPSTGVTSSLSNPIGYLTAPAFGDPSEVAIEYARSHLDLLGLEPGDLDDLEVTDTVYSEPTGSTHVYLGQRHQDLPIYNAQLQIHENREGRIASVNNAFIPGLAKSTKSAEPVISALQAVRSAARHLGVPMRRLPRVTSPPLGVQQRTSLAAGEISSALVDAQLMWLPVGRALRLVWRFQIHTLDDQHIYDLTVDAETGRPATDGNRVMTRVDWVSSAQYRVYPQPVESPEHTSPSPPADGRTLVVDPDDPTASPLGWHDTDSVSYTILRGNNVHAYQDADANNQPPASEPSCGSSLNCDFGINLGGSPSGYQSAATANLFYWNNVVHDVQYHYGFDEAGGNFQVDNFSKGGQGGDDVRAEAQDGSGTCNANFATPADGGRPRMQMFTCSEANPARDGDLDNGVIVHEYGHGISIRQVGGPSNSSCLSNRQQGGEGWSDFFALVYTVEAGDQSGDARGIGTYLFGQPPNGPGIRPQPYSTDPAVNDYTYESISGQVIPHGVGSVWAQVLWEVNWALVDVHGFDPNLYDVFAGAGNHRALLYVNEGLKNTACSPTFVDARDGIIQAAVDNFGGADVCLLWDTFANFGLGTDAVSGGSNSTNPTNGFQLPPQCLCQPAPVANAGPDKQICLGESATLGTAAVPGQTYSWSPGGETTAQITVSPASTTIYTLTASNSCGMAQDVVNVSVDDGTGGLLDDFESGASAWSVTGLWHLATDSQCTAPAPGFASPVTAFYFGQDARCDYNTQARVSGNLTSRPVSGINADSTLTFSYFRSVESYPQGAFDRTEVQIVTQGGSTTTVFALDSTDPSNLDWTSSGSISLAAFAGQTIQVRFAFDSVDTVANGFIGWLIDDVAVTASSCTGNTPPSVAITAPPDGTLVVEGTTLNFAGNATDDEDGDLTANLSWSSSLDGNIGAGGTFSRVLSVGVHTITSSVIDSGGASGSASIDVTVVANTPPSVTISAPADGSTFTEGASVTFSGRADDVEDGDLTTKLSWVSSLDGTIGSGGSFSTTTLSLGSHTITASVTDSHGLTASDAIAVTIQPDTGGCTDCIDWNNTPTVSYSNQDRSGTVTVQDGGATLAMTGNRWRRTTQTFNVTSFTVIEFDFMSTSQGEIHGIGFDEDDSLNNNTRIFEIFGTQIWNNAFQVPDKYTTGDLGNFKSFRINVGDVYTGNNMFLVLVNDKDAGAANNTGFFRNVRVFEDQPEACAVVLHATDFEAGPDGWFHSPADSTCSTGDWVVGNPDGVTNGGVTTQLEDDHTPTGVNAFFTAPNSGGAGINDVDGGVCTALSPVIDATGYPSAEVTFWYYHGQRDAGDDAAGDFFRIDLSADGGTTYSTNLVSLGDVTSNAAWKRVMTTVANPGLLRLRIQASDGAGPGDLVEAGLDDIVICIPQ